jgi:hypothetical protein
LKEDANEDELLRAVAASSENNDSVPFDYLFDELGEDNNQPAEESGIEIID